MHVFIGGAHNGKRKFVEQWLQQNEINEASWFDGVLPPSLNKNQTVVIHQVEDILAQMDLSDEEQVAMTIYSQLQMIAEEHRLLVILTDMGRGIVPFEPKARQLRDACGRLYQLLFQEAEEVTRIWYGLAEKLK